MTMMNAQEIYENFARARGPEDLEAAQEALHSVAAEYQVLAQEIANVAAAFEQGWTGDASGAAERGAGPLTVQHAEASEALNLAQDLLRRQVESFWMAKNSVEPVPPVPAAPSTITNVITLGSAGAGYEQFVTEAGAAAQRNVAAMELWVDHSAYNTTMMPTTYGEISPPEVSISLAEGTQLGGTGGGPPSTAEAPQPVTTPEPATTPEAGTGGTG
ncbi:hypothetical protein QDK53_14050, partial [Amycolatopsis magusensis]|nr:hypothetical protein [Amycolatopsis magusensis]